MDKQIENETPVVHVLLDERDIRTTYTNGFRTNHTHDDVSIDFAYNFPYPDPSGRIKAQAMFKVSDRMVMTWPSLKRLGETINTLIKVREAKYAALTRGAWPFPCEVTWGSGPDRQSSLRAGSRHPYGPVE